MSHHTKLESGGFRQQAVEEIVAELHLENDELVRVLVGLRPSPSQALRQRVRAITDMEQAKEMEKAGEPRRERILPLLPRLVLRASVVTAILLVAVFLLIAAVPSVRATFGRIMQQRFGLVLVEPVLETTSAIEPEANSEVLTEVKVIPPISLEEAQAQVPFTIPMPAILPEGFELWAARVGTGPHGESMDEDGNRIVTVPPIAVILHFKPDEDNQGRYHPEATLGLDIMDRIGLSGGYAAPAGSEQEVDVNGNSAVFVKGAWIRPDENKPPSPDNLIWDDAYDAAMLSWEANGLTYILSGSHLGLSQEDYIRIAESVR